VARHLRLGEFLLGVEGIALMRHLFDDDAQAAARLAEIRRIACGGEAVYQLGADVPVVDVASGYARWSQTYDNPGNPLIQLEQPVVWSILDAVAPGAALDAACGTGRHARRLAELGHHVIGVDASPAMLDRARAALPRATFRDGDLSALPLEPASVDLVVCALARQRSSPTPPRPPTSVCPAPSSGNSCAVDPHGQTQPRSRVAPASRLNQARGNSIGGPA
jgi:SAM-dependent methyltransferase